MNRIVLILCIILFPNYVFTQNTQLENNVRSIIKGKKATVGVAIIYEGKDTLTINDQYHYPTMSTYKFHLALAVLDHLNKNNLPLETEIFIKKSDLEPNTYSPLRDEKPSGNFSLSIAELLKYSVSMSDNNACDILFNYIGGTSIVDKYISGLGIHNISITATEKTMNKKWENQYLNWTTPKASVQLLETFLKKDLFAPIYKDFLINAMIATSTGSDKIKGLLPSDIIIGHKTGSGSRGDFGIKTAENDMGFVNLPNGKQYSIAIYVMNSREDDKATNAIIAEISKAVYDYYKEISN